jgi:hypothetical protein
MASPSTSSSVRQPDCETPRSLADALQWLRSSFHPERSRGLDVAYGFELTGSAGGGLWARVTNGELATGVGSVESPDVVFRLPASDFFGVLAGTVNPDLLFMEQKLAVEGDLSLALKLRSLFSPTS